MTTGAPSGESPVGAGGAELPPAPPPATLEDAARLAAAVRVYLVGLVWFLVALWAVTR